MSANDTELIEQLFLDVSIQYALNNTGGTPVVKSWATKYVNAIRDGRFGDAIWARYHIEGNVQNDFIGDTNMTVLEMIGEDAEEYRVNAPSSMPKLYRSMQIRAARMGI